MLKHLVPIAAAALLLLIVLAGSIPLYHWFEIDDATDVVDLNEELWRDLGIDSYEFVIRKDCDCGPPGNMPVRIVVRDSLTIAAYDSRSSFDSSVDRIEGLPDSVADLFALVRAASVDVASRVEVSYDPQFGFPVQITTRPDSVKETSYSISQFQEIDSDN
jgi:hypothetical protein